MAHGISRFTVALPADLRTCIERMRSPSIDNRTMSAQIETLLREALTNRGYRQQPNGRWTPPVHLLPAWPAQVS